MDPRWTHFLEVCRQRHPKFKLVAKEDSLLMKLIFYVLFMKYWCPDFNNGITTTLFQTVYMPQSLWGTVEGYRVMMHEEKHIADSRAWPVLFQLSYLGPIPIGPLNLRWLWEYRAYVITLEVHYETRGKIPDSLIDWIVSLFTGPMYLWMMPFGGFIRKKLERERDRILSEGA